MLLQEFKQRAIDAHNWTSFSPEKRGASLIEEFSGVLEEDIEELKKVGVPEELIPGYVERFKRYFSSWIGAKSRCASSMITGPSNFPVRRAEKANRSEHNHYVVFTEWRKRAKKAMIRNAQPEKTFLSEIDRYKKDLESMKNNQELMKACNSVIRKAKGKDCTEALVKCGLSEAMARKIMIPDYAGRIGFPGFSLTNNNANIKRVEGRIKEMEAKEERSTKVGQEAFSFVGGVVILNHEVDRVQIMHEQKPSREQLDEMKKKGLSSFNWSPSAKAWQRKITNAAIRQANEITGVNIPYIYS